MAKLRLQDWLGWTTSPFVLGGAATAGLYAAIYGGHLTQPMMVRYLAGHPIEIITTALFMVALAAQGNKILAVWTQNALLARTTLGEVPAGGQDPSVCGELLEEVASWPSAFDGYLRERLKNGLEYVRRKNSAATLDAELKFLSDSDAGRRPSGHALVKVIIWAIPILGFLGTVVGLTDAIANLSPDALEKSLPAVTSGLGVSFDTTALSLALSMVLMFGQFWVDRSENHLLDSVDRRVHEELASRFKAVPAAGSGGAASAEMMIGVKRLTEEVLRACVVLVEQQAELWRDTLGEAEGRWRTLASEQEKVLGASLADALRTHAQAVVDAQEQGAERNRQAWEKIDQSLTAVAASLQLQQAETSKQCELLKQVVEASCEVTRLEDVLNRNLTSLARMGDFEEMVHSLSAAVHLLTVKSSDARNVSLPRRQTEGQAA